MFWIFGVSGNRFRLSMAMTTLVLGVLNTGLFPTMSKSIIEVVPLQSITPSYSINFMLVMVCLLLC
jgi:cytochrome bd-type quinol oxidase subunit 2